MLKKTLIGDKMNRIRGFLFALGVVLFSTVAQGVNKYPHPTFLKQEDVVIESTLSAPPAPTSAEEKADFAELFRFQKTRTKADCRRAADAVKVSLNSFFGPQYGPLSKDEVAQWSDFFEKVRVDTDYFVQETKKKWHRERPYVEDPQIKPCVTLENTGAYPSGHAAISRVFAEVLSMMDPSRRIAFSVRADQIAIDRVISGLHHPTDIEAGKKLGDKVFAELKNNKSFMSKIPKTN